MSDPSIRTIAGKIQLELPDLLASEDATRVDGQLSKLFARADAGEDVEAPLVTLLASREATRARLDELLPESISAGERSYEPLPGHSPEAPLFPLYECPEGDYKWPQFEAGEAVPECPVHHVPLVLRVD